MKDHADTIALRRKTIGNFFKSARETSGLTQKQVADHLSYSTAQFISNWERGLSAPPMETLPTLTKLYKLNQKDVVDAIHEFQIRYVDLQRKELMRQFKNS